MSDLNANYHIFIDCRAIAHHRPTDFSSCQEEFNDNYDEAGATKVYHILYDTEDKTIYTIVGNGSGASNANVLFMSNETVLKCGGESTGTFCYGAVNSIITLNPEKVVVTTNAIDSHPSQYQGGIKKMIEQFEEMRSDGQRAGIINGMLRSKQCCINNILDCDGEFSANPTPYKATNIKSVDELALAIYEGTETGWIWQFTWDTVTQQQQIQKLKSDWLCA